MPTSLGQEKEILLIQQSSTGCSLLTIYESFTPLFIVRESQGFRKPQMDSAPFQKRSPNRSRRSKFTCQPIRRVTDPLFRPTGRSTEPNRKLGMPVSRLEWSTVLLATVDRAMPVQVVHAGRSGSGPATAGLHLDCLLAPFWIPISALFF